MPARSSNTQHNSSIQWKKRPSELRGFTKTFYATLPNRDYARVDYSYKDKRVRLYVEVAKENGAAYYAFISNGRVSTERNAQSGRTSGVASVLRDRNAVFSTLNDAACMKIIGDAYGIAGQRNQQNDDSIKKVREETKKRYFRAEENPYDDIHEAGADVYRRGFSIWDVLDTGVGLLLAAAAFWYYNFSYIALGIVAAFYGIILGLYDMFIREQAPSVVKSIFFLLAGFSAYIYGYYVL